VTTFSSFVLFQFQFQSKPKKNSKKEHPILGIPFYHIHPCNTSKLLHGAIEEGSYLLGWLSIFGSLLGLHVRIEHWMRWKAQQD
jgi:hypothetical protein